MTYKRNREHGIYSGYRRPIEPYVFLETLKTDEFQASKIVGGEAIAALNWNKNNTPYHSQIMIQNALNFLQQAADLQRKHEEAFLFNCLRKLNKYNGEEADKIKQEFASKDYISIINRLNTTLQGINEWTQRLNTFTAKELDVRGQRDIVASSTTLINGLLNARKEYEMGYNDLIRDLTIKFFTTNPIAKQFIAEQVGKNGAEQLVTAAAIVQQQLMKYLTESGTINYGDGTIKYTKNKIEQYKEMFYELEKKIKDFTTSSNIERIFGDKDLLKEAQQLYGLEYKEKIAKSSNSAASKEAQRALQQMHDELGLEDMLAGKNKQFKNAIKHIKVTFDPNNKGQWFGNMKEFQSLLIKLLDGGTGVGRLSGGTDVLLGQFSAEIPQMSSQANQNMFKVLGNKIKNAIREQQAQNDPKKIAKIYETELNNFNEDLKEIGEGFIIHETTKFYQQLEQGKWWNNHAGFKGRNMNLFHYIDAMNTFAASNGIDTTWLRFAAYNLADSALSEGQKNKAPLEEYFAIFAGIIMFDDFVIIGKEVSEEIEYSNFHNLHLYHLNDMYFPASYFLQETYNLFNKEMEDMFEGNGFTVTITPPKVVYNKESGSTFEERWEEVKDQATKGTTIQLRFAANFLNFVSKLKK